MIVALIAVTAVVLLTSGSDGSVPRDLIGLTSGGSDSGLDLYLVTEGESPDPSKRIATNASFDPIIPIDGPYEEGPHGPIAVGPTAQRIGDRTAVAWWRPTADSHVSELVLVDDDGTVTPVLKESSPPTQGGPIETYYSKEADALLSIVRGSTTKCHRTGPDGIPVLIVEGADCVFLANGLVWSYEAAGTNSTVDPTNNSFTVALHDMDGDLISTASVSGVTSIKPNGTGERTFGTTAKEFRIYETRTGGLVAQASGSRSARSIGQSRSSNVAAYIVDDDVEQLAATIVREDGSKIELGNFLRVAVELTPDGSTAFISSSILPSSTSSSDTSNLTVKVERLDVVSGLRETIDTGRDLRTTILGWDEPVVVIWSPDGDRLWRGPPAGDLERFDVPLIDKTRIDLVVETGELIIIAGKDDSVRADLLGPDGTLIPITSGWDALWALEASGKAPVLLFTGERGNETTLFSWTEEGGFIALDTIVSVYSSAIIGGRVTYEARVGSEKSHTPEIRRVPLEGGEPEIVMTDARLLSTPYMSFSVSSDLDQSIGSSFRTPHIDEVASRCRALGRQILKRGESAVGTLGSTDVCIVVDSPLTTLTVVSTADSTMSVTDATGQRVAYDDDSGYSMNPYISGSLPIGTYVVSVDAYRPSSYGGTFTIRFD